MDVQTALLDFGALGIFCAFLVRQHVSMQKRLDALVQRFQTQLDQLQNKKEAREASLRERYDTVISTLQNEKSSFRVDMESQIKLALIRLEELDKKTDEIKVLSDSLTLIHRESNIQTVKALGILEKMEEEARLKEMARKIQNKDEPNWERR